MVEAFNLKRFNLLSGDATVRNSLISLGGVLVTDYVPRANILDIRIGAAGIQNTTLQRGYKAGSDFIRRRHTTRIIEVEIELPLDRQTYPENVHLIRAWADKAEPQEMILSAYRDRKIMVSCTNLNEFSQKEWWLPVILRFEAWEPYFVSRSARTAKVGELFTVNGDVEPVVCLTHDLGSSTALSNPKWVLDGGKHVALNRTFSGGKIDINFDNGAVIYNDQSVLEDMTLTSRMSPFANITPGQHVISGPTGGVITWYERWL